MKQKIEKFSTDRGEITWITLINRAGASVKLSTWGAGIVALAVPDRHGDMANVVLNYPRPEDYFDDGPCAGKTPGRYANRIGNGTFELDGVSYQLDVNNGPNHLHGGLNGFQNRNWEYTVDDVDTVTFKLKSPDGDQHYPGRLSVTVTYRWAERHNRLTIEYMAFVDGKPTIVNLTNHTYWNLTGFSDRDIMSHRLMIPARSYLVTDDSLCPTGEIAPVKGTPMDFTAPKALGADIKAQFKALIQGKGYDALWVLDNAAGSDTVVAAELHDPVSGRCLTVSTDQPGVQIYTGNWLEGCPEGPGAIHYSDYAAVAIECQGYPDAPNHPQFPSQRLDTIDNDGIYNHTIDYTFTIK